MNIDDALLARAMKMSGLTEKTAVVHAGLEALIERVDLYTLDRPLAREWTRLASGR